MEFETKTRDVSLLLKGDLERIGTCDEGSGDRVCNVPVYSSKGPVTATLYTPVELDAPIAGENGALNNFFAIAGTAAYDEVAKTYTKTGGPIGAFIHVGGGGAPASTGTPAKPAFTGVAVEADYAQAVLWAAARGITKGTSAAPFDLGNTRTRGQIVTFLYRAYAK